MYISTRILLLFDGCLFITCQKYSSIENYNINKSKEILV